MSLSPEVYLIWAFIFNPESYGAELIHIPEEYFSGELRKVFRLLRQEFLKDGVHGVIKATEDETIVGFISDIIENYPEEREKLDYVAMATDGSLFNAYLSQFVEEVRKRKIENLFNRYFNDKINFSELSQKIKDLENFLYTEKITIDEEKDELLMSLQMKPAFILPFVEAAGQPVKAYPGDLVLISAPTKAGKTTLAMNMFLNLMDTPKDDIIDLENLPLRKGVYISYEIKSGIILRMLLGIKKEKHWENTTKEEIEEFIEEYKGRMALKDALLLEDIVALVWNFKPDFFVIDYDQLVLTKGRFESEERRVAYITRTLKNLAEQTDSVCLLLSQENEEGKARYSREKEHAASIHIRIQKSENSDVISVYVPLNRWGKAGSKETSKELEVDWATRKLKSIDGISDHL